MVTGVVVFVISTAMPVIASLIPEAQVPQWVGYFDVVLAFVFVIVAVLVDAAAKGAIDDQVIKLSYRIYRVAASLLLVLLVTFFVIGEAIRWNVLLPGLAWRAWLFIYVLPSALALWKQGRA